VTQAISTAPDMTLVAMATSRTFLKEHPGEIPDGEWTTKEWKREGCPGSWDEYDSEVRIFVRARLHAVKLRREDRELFMRAARANGKCGFRGRGTTQAHRLWRIGLLKGDTSPTKDIGRALILVLEELART
jgi:hypothetical protein